MQLSVIILNYNVRYFLELCLHSVSKSVEDLDAEIIVVDNASPDGSCEMVKRLFPDIILIQNSENLGFAKANNQAAKIAKGEWVCILNPDTVVGEDCFKNILKYSNSIKNLGILGCRLMDGSGNFLPESKRNIPTTKISFQKLRGNSDLYYANHIKENSIAEVDILVGAFMLLKKSLYEKVGGFDEDFFMYAEDVDLCYRVLNAGYKNIYYGEESVIHFKGESTIKDSKYLKNFYGSMQVFYKKHFRKNVVYDIAVWFGIRLVPIFKKHKDLEKIKTKSAVLVSNLRLKNLQENLEVPLTQLETISSLANDSTYIFNVESIPFKSILKCINKGASLKNSNFRFYMPRSNFIIGSDNSNDRGQILFLKD
ncbi:Glycosyltransferase, GT2 family [Flavobacteriaceae bacterium MAR_2010_188]|nr:Glycosyltransferase, GT2 family [Flavobacteriaceae bacterium MAR_2010_188]